MASNNHRGEILQGKGLDLSRLAQWQLGSSTTNPLVNSNLSSKSYFLKKIGPSVPTLFMTIQNTNRQTHQQNHPSAICRYD